MLHIKKLDIFILKSFCLLFVGTFLICLFIFMMQFLWKYVDDMVGKGLDVTVLAQFFFYASLTLVPASLPLAVLLASLITFGNFGERYELLAMKAAGISLLQIMRPLIVFVGIICCVSFFFQNYIGPKAQTKLWTLVISMKQKSPELDIPERTFYDQIDGYNLYVESKDRKTGMLYNVMIYNFANGFENAQIIRADSGRMEMTADKQHLYLHLYNGEQFENLQQQNMKQRNVPYRRESFEEKNAIIEFNANFNIIDEGFMTSQSNSKNMAMLEESIDSMRLQVDSMGQYNYKTAVSNTYRVLTRLADVDTLKLSDAAATGGYSIDSVLARAPLSDKQTYYNEALNNAITVQSDWSFRGMNINQTMTSLRRHQTAWHEKITLSLACLIFFFIGAPLGGIIRKGGLGMPVVVSVIIFIFYYIVNNTGYKMARDGKWPIMAGMWLSTAVLAPLGAFLTYKSNNDSVVLNMDTYVGWIKRVLGIRTKRHFMRKDVIIRDIDYRLLPDKLHRLSADLEEYSRQCRLRSAPNYLTLWTNVAGDERFAALCAEMEEVIEEMSNSRSLHLLNVLGKYPVMADLACRRPFVKTWPNVVCAVVLPVGLFFYIRIWVFRTRLDRDIKEIANINSEAIEIIDRLSEEET